MSPERFVKGESERTQTVEHRRGGSFERQRLRHMHYAPRCHRGGIRVATP
jgi:hypothetical protein